MVRVERYKKLFLDNFDLGIVSDVAGGTNQNLNRMAEDILNFVPGKQGELKKIPIGYYIGELANKIEKVIYFPAPTGDEFFVSTDDGKFYKLLYKTFTQISFPSQDFRFGDSDNYTAQPTIITDYFTFGGKLYLLTGTKCNYVYSNGEIKIWGQRGILPPQ